MTTQALEEATPSIRSPFAGAFGAVTVRDHFWVGPDGREYSGIVGNMTVLPVEQVMGFKVSHRDANWVVEIRGENTRIFLPGCGVLGFHLGTHGVGEHYYMVP